MPRRYKPTNSPEQREARARRTEWIVFRASESERDRWRKEAEASEMTVSDFVRQRIDGPEAVVSGRNPVRRRYERATAPRELVAAVNRLGSNVNQLARWANTWKSKVEAIRVVAALSVTDRHLQALLEIWTPEPEPEVDTNDA